MEIDSAVISVSTSEVIPTEFIYPSQCGVGNKYVWLSFILEYFNANHTLALCTLKMTEIQLKQMVRQDEILKTNKRSLSPLLMCNASNPRIDCSTIWVWKNPWKSMKKTGLTRISNKSREGLAKDALMAEQNTGLKDLQTDILFLFFYLGLQSHNSFAIIRIQNQSLLFY